MRTEKRETPYFSFAYVGYKLTLCWAIFLVISFTLWRLHISVDESQFRKYHYVLNLSYPALAHEVDQLPTSRFSSFSGESVFVVFIINSCALYIMSISHYIILRRRRPFLKQDGGQVIALVFLAIIGIFLVGNLSKRNSDFYNDSVDLNGLFLVKRIVLTACLSYLVVVGVVNLELKLKRR